LCERDCGRADVTLVTNSRSNFATPFRSRNDYECSIAHVYELWMRLDDCRCCCCWCRRQRWWRCNVTLTISVINDVGVMHMLNGAACRFSVAAV